MKKLNNDLNNSFVDWINYIHPRLRKISTVLLFLCIAVFFLLPTSAYARSTSKTVRVGWYESPFNTTDQFGRRSGYAYDYQQKIAAYTGWNYEYVEGSWPELMQMLIDGEIDLMSDVSYTEERSQAMLFSSLPMGSEEYYIYISPGNGKINRDDFSTFNGKKAGANKGSVQVGFFKEWAQNNGVQAELVEMTESLDEAINMLNRGDIDMYIVVDGYFDVRTAVPVCKVGASDFFFAINRSRPDLLAELNFAMNRIQEGNHNYNQQLYDKYLRAYGFNYYLGTEEKNWLSNHGPIRVGYQDYYLAFCASDEKTGTLTGALKDYLEEASTCFANAELRFEPVAYPSAAAAIEALKNGEVDCVFPSNLSIFDGEDLDLVMTPSLMTSEVYAVVRKADQQTFLQKEQITVAAVKGDPNYKTVKMDHFPNWKWDDYPDIQACLKAVADSRADCVLISNYQYNNLSRKCDKLKLTALATGKSVDYFIAVCDSNTELYSILARTTDIVSNTSINASLSYYSTEEAKISFWDYIKENPVVLIANVFIVLSLISVIVAQQRNIGARKAIKESNQQVAALSRRVFVDALTGVKNKAGFDEYTRGIQKRIDGKEKFEFAVIIMDCDDLKQVNDQYGHDKGDIYIESASRLICRVFKHSPVFRIGGDEFAVVLQDEDYQDRKELAELFEKISEKSCNLTNRWEHVCVSMGMAEFDLQADNSVTDVIRRADRAMYENKRARKEAHVVR